MANRTQTADFWVGVFRDEDLVFDYFGESADYYKFLDDDPPMVQLTPNGGPPVAGREPLTRFLADHDQQWYDHDMVELGFNSVAKNIAELVHPHSYGDQYAEQLTKLAAALDIGQINTFIFVTAGEVREPRSTSGDGFVLKYAGQITYNI